MHRLVKEADEIMLKMDQPDKDKNKLASIRKSLSYFTTKNYQERELCIEAQLVIERIDRTIGNLL